MKKPFIVGITGGSGSGKTFFINQLVNHFNRDEICLISQDNYYKSIEQVPLDEHNVHNFDTLEAIDFKKFKADIQKIINGESITIEEYTFNNSNLTPRTFSLVPAPIIIIEGIFVLVKDLIDDLLDFKLFIDAREEVKLKRRIVRDYQERGYDINDVLYRYEHHVSPAYEKLIAPCRHHADVVIPNNSTIDQSIDMVKTYLNAKI